jgi:hypothetical protein
MPRDGDDGDEPDSTWLYDNEELKILSKPNFE